MSAVKAHRFRRKAIGVWDDIEELKNDPIGLDERLYWTYMGYNKRLEYKRIWSAVITPDREEWSGWQTLAEMGECKPCGKNYSGKLTVDIKDRTGKQHRIQSD